MLKYNTLREIWSRLNDLNEKWFDHFSFIDVLALMFVFITSACFMFIHMKADVSRILRGFLINEFEILDVRVEYDLTKIRVPRLSLRDVLDLGKHFTAYDFSGPKKPQKIALALLVFVMTPVILPWVMFFDTLRTIICSVEVRTADYRTFIDKLVDVLDVQQSSPCDREKLEQCISKFLFFRRFAKRFKLNYIVKLVMDCTIFINRQYQYDDSHSIDLASLLKVFLGENMLMTHFHGLIDMAGECLRVYVTIDGVTLPLKELLIAENLTRLLKQSEVTVNFRSMEPFMKSESEIVLRVPDFSWLDYEPSFIYTRITTYKRAKWVSYGSHGDIQPIKAVVASLTARRMKVDHVTPVSEDKGSEDLAHLENQDLLPSLRSVSAVQHEVLPMSSEFRLVVPASYLGPPGSAIVHGLEPPSDCSEPMTLDIPLMDFTAAILSGRRRENRRCGETLFNIPRLSRNGAYFRRKAPLEPRLDACVNVGSSSIVVPEELKHLPVPVGDHTELFRKYRRVYCHGGAGTATTAIASGAEVVSLSRVLDRRWKVDAHNHLSLHGDDHFTMSALLSESIGDFFSDIYSEVSVLSRAISLVIALAGLTYHSLIGIKKIVATLNHNGFRLKFISNISLMLPEMAVCMVAWILGAEMRPLINVSIQRTHSLCDGPITDLIYYVLAAHPICDLTLNQNAYFMDLISGALVASNDQTCEVWLSLTKVWSDVPVYHSSLVGEGFRLQGTEVDGDLVCANDDNSIDVEEILIPLPIMRSDILRDVGNLGRYGPECNCHTYVIDLLNSSKKRTSCWVGYLTLCTCLIQTVGPLSLIYLERLGDDIPLFRLIADAVREKIRAAAPIYKDLSLEEQDIVCCAHALQWDTTPLGDLFDLPYPVVQNQIEKTVTRASKTRLKARELGDIRAAFDSCICCSEGLEVSDEASCVLCNKVSRSIGSMTPSAIKLFAYHLMQGDFCPETISDLKRRLKGWAFILNICIITDILNDNYESVEVVKHGDETRTCHNLCAVKDVDGYWTVMPQKIFKSPLTLEKSVTDSKTSSHVINSLVEYKFDFRQRSIDFFAGAIVRATLYVSDALTGFSTVLTNYALLPTIDPDDPPVKSRASWGLQSVATTQTNYIKFVGLLSDTVKLTDVVGEEAMNRAISDLNAVKPEGQPPLELNSYSRKVKIPEMSGYARGRKARALDELEAQVGENHLQFATKSNILASLSRYSLDNTIEQLSDIDYDDAVEALFSAVPEAFGDHHLKTPEFVARSIVWKYSCGVPFEGNEYLKKTPLGVSRATLRRRLDLRRSGWLGSVTTLVNQQLKTGEIPNDLHHAFVKNYISTKEKLDADPGSIRTVVAQELSAYVRNMVFNYSLDKRMTQLSDSAPWAVGTRLSGGGYNKRFSHRTSKRKHWVIDGKAFDSNVSHKVLQAVADLRSKGFSNHPEQESIKRWLAGNMNALEKSTMYDIYNRSYVPHEKGHTTGQSSVTSTNQMAVLLILSKAYAAATGKTPKEFFTSNQIDAMGEDVHIGSDMTDNEMKVLLSDAARQGVVFRVEGESHSLLGLEWCKKKFVNPLTFKADFEFADIPMPNYALVHDPESIAMRQTASAHKDTATFYYVRTLGHALLTAHNKPLYEWLKKEADMLRPLLRKTRGGRALMKNSKFPSYKRVLVQYYQEPPDRSTPLKFQDPLLEYLRREKQVSLGISSFARALRNSGLKHMAGKRVTAGTDTLLQPPVNVIAAAIRDVSRPATTREEMRAKVSLGPASSVINVDYFWDHQSDKIGYIDPNVSSGVILSFEIFTVLVSNALNSLKRLPGLRIPLYLHSLAYREGIHIYGLFSGIYYAANGRPSAFLATFAPKDPLILEKRIASFVVEFIFFLGPFLPMIGLATKNVSNVIDLLSHFRNPLSYIDSYSGRTQNRTVSNRWESFVRDQIIPSLSKGNIIVSAPTGTGKTREMPKQLERIFEQVLILFPKVKQCEMSGYYRMKKKQPALEKGISCSTWGHAVARYTRTPHKLKGPSTTVVIIDEAHNRDASIVPLSLLLSKRLCVILCSATPTLDERHAPFGTLGVVKAPFPRPFALKIEEKWGANPVDVAIKTAKNVKGIILVFMPSIAKCSMVCTEIESHGLECSIFSSKHPLQLTKVIVATSIAEDGLNIKGVSVVIDSMRMIVKHKGRILEAPCDTDTATQRAGRAGRFEDGIAIRCGPTSLRNYVTYPTTEDFCRDPSLWSNTFDIRTVLVPFPDGTGELYKPSIPNDFNLSMEEKRIICSYLLRHDTSEDALSNTKLLLVTDDHDDIFEGHRVLKEELATNSTLLKQIISSRPFFVNQNGKTVNWPWLRLADGQLTADDTRVPLLNIPSDSSVRALTEAEVGRECSLPSSAFWSYTRRKLSFRQVIRTWVCFSIVPNERLLKKKVRLLPELVSASNTMNDVIGYIEPISTILCSSIYVRYKNITRFINNGFGNTNPVALIDVSEDSCRYALWQTASIAPSTCLAAASSIAVLATSPLAKHPVYWDKMTINMVSRFNKNEEMLKPLNSWAWNMVSDNGPDCYNDVCRNLGVPLLPSGVRVTIDDLIAHISHYNMHVSVHTLSGHEIIEVQKPRKKSKKCVKDVRLYNIGDHVSLGVLLEPAADNYYPPNPMRSRFLHEHSEHFKDHDVVQEWSDWKQLYVGEDHGALKAEKWSSWADISMRLDEFFGSDYQIDVVGPTTEIRHDHRVRKLAGWSSYHRTQVLVNYKNKCHFVILPDVSKPAHKKAKPGRRVVIELGHEGARHWFSSEPGWRAFKDVFTPAYIANCMADIDDVLSVKNMIRTPMINDSRYKRAKMLAVQSVLRHFPHFDDAKSTLALFKRKRWPVDNIASYQHDYTDTIDSVRERLEQMYAGETRAKKRNVAFAAYALLAQYRLNKALTCSSSIYYGKVLRILGLGVP